MPNNARSRGAAGQGARNPPSPTGRRPVAGRDDQILTSKEHEALVAESEIGELQNPYFSYERCPRYTRLHEFSVDKERKRLDKVLDEAAGGEGQKLSAASWRKKAAQEISRWEEERKHSDDRSQSLWLVVVHADEIRTLSAADCARDGYRSAMLIIRDKQVLLVGQSAPLPSETVAHYTVFLCEYEDNATATAQGDNGEAGIKSVRTVNDTCAIIIHELAKVMFKLLLATRLIDFQLSSHLSLYTDVTGRFEDMRKTLIQLERHTDS